MGVSKSAKWSWVIEIINDLTKHVLIHRWVFGLKSSDYNQSLEVIICVLLMLQWWSSNHSMHTDNPPNSTAHQRCCKIRNSLRTPKPKNMIDTITTKKWRTILLFFSSCFMFLGVLYRAVLSARCCFFPFFVQHFRCVGQGVKANLEQPRKSTRFSNPSLTHVGLRSRPNSLEFCKWIFILPLLRKCLSIAVLPSQRWNTTRWRLALGSPCIFEIAHSLLQQKLTDVMGNL